MMCTTYIHTVPTCVISVYIYVHIWKGGQVPLRTNFSQVIDKYLTACSFLQYVKFY